jgi:hypothetical protein
MVFDDAEDMTTNIRQWLSPRYFVVLILLVTIVVSMPPVEAAKYAGDPFSLGVGGRGLAMGGAVIAGPFDATAAYWNPAGLARLSTRQITAMHAETFGSLLNQDFVAYTDARPRTGGPFRAFSFYIYYIGGGGIKITRQDEQTGRYYVLREESHADVLFSAAIAGELSPRLDFGLTVKIIHRNLGTETGKGLTLDAGLLYSVRPWLQAGLMVTDATSGFIRYTGETFGSGGYTESIYPTVKPGLMLQRPLGDFVVRMAVSGDIKFEHLNEAAQYHTGSLSLDSHYGWELAWKEMLFGRMGFDIGRFTAGGGLAIGRTTVDFAYLHHSDLDETFRVSAAYRL